MKVVCTIEARMTSSRLPGKVLKEIVGQPVLALMIERLKRVPSIDQIVIATTDLPTDDPVEALANDLNVGVFRGSEDDVLDRVLKAAQAYDADVIIETTGDCPLIDPVIVEDCIQAYKRAGVDYLSNVLKRTYPIGMDTQVFATDILADVAKRTDDPDDHEHVSLFIYRHPDLYSLENVAAPDHHTAPDLALTLDTAEDFELIKSIFEGLYPDNPTFDLDDILTLLAQRPELQTKNAHVKRKTV